MERDAAYKIDVECATRARLAEVAAATPGLRAQGLGLVLREGKVEIGRASLVPLRAARGWSATLFVSHPAALAFCLHWADGGTTALHSPDALVAANSAADNLPGFADSSGVIRRAGTDDASALAATLVERLTASTLPRLLDWRTGEPSIIADVIANTSAYAWPLQTVLYVATLHGWHMPHPALADALQRRAIMRRGARDRALAAQVLGQGEPPTAM